MEANELKELIFKRTNIISNELSCPRENSSMTPCVARDGDFAMLKNKTCIGCNNNVIDLLTKEKLKHE